MQKSDFNPWATALRADEALVRSVVYCTPAMRAQNLGDPLRFALSLLQIRQEDPSKTLQSGTSAGSRRKALNKPTATSTRSAAGVPPKALDDC